ncbi:MAG TPA: NAD(P)-dependent alcohol dehydrogenase [Polyangiaceae bacterium]
MRVVCLSGGFGLDHVRLEERPEPVPGRGEVLVRVRAASLNHRDLLMAKGEYDRSLRGPLVLGSDACGEVVALGEGARRFAAGDRVCPTLARGWLEGPPGRDTPRRALGGPLDGTFAEWLVAGEEDLVRAPATLGDVEAATLPCAGVTAYRALFEEGSVDAGSTVLVIGTGGVSMFALLLARAAGARVVVVSRDAAKLERALALGATHGIDSTQHPEWGVLAREWADGRGVDYVIEIGGAGTLAQSLRAVRAGGTIALIGTVAAGATPSLVPVVMRNVRLQGIFVGPRSTFEALVERVERSRLAPVVDRVFPLAEYRAAFEYLESGRPFGKVALRMG